MTFPVYFRRLVREATKAGELTASQRNSRRADAVLLRKQIADHEKARWLAVQEGWNLGSTTRRDMKAHDVKVDAYMKQKMAQAEYVCYPIAHTKRNLLIIKRKRKTFFKRKIRILFREEEKKKRFLEKD